MSHAPDTLRKWAREMRHEPTRAESRVWSWLRNRRFGNFKFRRQHPVGRCIVDFYCAELKLAIEMDGNHHNTSWRSEHEAARTAYLARRGIEVVHILNQDLVADPRAVAERIAHVIRQRAT